jgi:hypothetical protein
VSTSLEPEWAVKAPPKKNQQSLRGADYEAAHEPRIKSHSYEGWLGEWDLSNINAKTYKGQNRNADVYVAEDTEGKSEDNVEVDAKWDFENLAGHEDPLMTRDDDEFSY